MVTIPQYPLISAMTSIAKAKLVGFHLDENHGWKVNVEDMQESYDKATAQGINVKCIVFINPSNPTGTVLDEESIEKILRFAHENRLLVMADEIYQDVVYKEEPGFISFRKVL